MTASLPERLGDVVASGTIPLAVASIELSVPFTEVTMYHGLHI